MDDSGRVNFRNRGFLNIKYALVCSYLHKLQLAIVEDLCTNKTISPHLALTTHNHSHNQLVMAYLSIPANTLSSIL